jgi:integrase
MHEREDHGQERERSRGTDDAAARGCHARALRSVSLQRGGLALIFFYQFTGRRFKAGSRIAVLREGFHAAARRAKLPTGFRQHDLRHWRATSWLAAKKSPVKVETSPVNAIEGWGSPI